ncbi:hypothetical protein ACX80D_10345 [Arthrobacter sp. Sr24]
MTTSTLTERYLAVAVRGMPNAQREEFQRELAERIADDIDARLEAGTSSAAAEYQTLMELGDPDLLVGSYRDHPQFLIGPRLFPVWKRLLRVIALTVIPTVGAIFVFAQLLAHKSLGEIVGSTIVTLITLTVHLGFWTTLVFVVLERTLRGAPLMEWKPESLPEITAAPRHEMRSDFIAHLVFIVMLVLGIIFHPLVLPFRDANGETVPLFNGSTWVWLQWWLVGALAVELVFWCMLAKHGRWSFGLALASAVPSLAFGVPLAWAFANDQLLNHAFLERTGWTDWAGMIAPGGVLAILAAFMTLGVAVATPIDGFVKARRVHRPSVKVHRKSQS